MLFTIILFPQVCETVEDQIDLLREQLKIVAREVTFCTSSQKRLFNQEIESSDDVELQVKTSFSDSVVSL